MTGLREHVLTVLSGRNRDQFLAALVEALALAGRGEYAEAGHTEAHTLAALRSLNEMMIVIGKQLRSSLAGNSAYPDEAFVQVLVDNATIGHIEPVLQWALKEAVGNQGKELPLAAQLSSSPSRRTSYYPLCPFLGLVLTLYTYASEMILVASAGGLAGSGGRAGAAWFFRRRGRRVFRPGPGSGDAAARGCCVTRGFSWRCR